MEKVMCMVDYAVAMAKCHHDPKGYRHAVRVAEYVSNNPMIPEEIKQDCIALAYMHDLLEDTDFSLAGLSDKFVRWMYIISRRKDQDYLDYVRNIKNKAASDPQTYWVKLADIKDHLMLKDTLTDRLWDKYLDALRILL